MNQKKPLLFLSLALSALLPVLVLMASPFLNSLILASIIAIVVHPFKQWLAVRTRRPVLATLITTFATVSVLGVLLTVAGVHLTRELKAAYNTANQRSLETGGWPALAVETADRIVDALSTRLPIDKDAIRAELLERLRGASGYLLSHVDMAVVGVTNIVVTFLLVTIFLYFLLQYGQEWLRRSAQLAPVEPRITKNIFRAIHDSVVANVSGALAVVAGQGAMLILGFWLVGLRSPVLWGSVGGLFSIIPLVGAPLLWVPVAVGYLLMGAYWKALFIGLWGAFVAGSVDNIVRPLVIGAQEKQPPMLIALATIGGTYAFGALGILLGPLVVSLTAALLKEIQPMLAGSNGYAADAGRLDP